MLTLRWQRFVIWQRVLVWGSREGWAGVLARVLESAWAWCLAVAGAVSLLIILTSLFQTQADRSAALSL